MWGPGNLQGRPRVRAAMEATRRLAAFVAALEPADLAPDAVDATVRTLVDHLAATVAGVDTVAGGAVRSYVEAVGNEGPAAIVGTDRRTGPLFAALANGTSAHALDVDDGHRAGSVHVGAPVIPAALALADREGASGPAFVAAVAAGVEAVAVSATAVQPAHRERGFHATATCGCLGAAAAAASLLGLDETRTGHALGLAGTQAGGLFEFLAAGSEAKRFHAGRAAMAGVLAADLAATGLDGPETIIEGEDGFVRAFAGEYDLSGFGGLGDPFEVTRLYLKPYPNCRHVHGPIDAALALREGGLDPAEIVGIRVETYDSAARHDRTEVVTLVDAQMSIPYGIAVALLDGDPRLDAFDPPRTDDTLRRLCRVTTVVGTDEMDAAYPETRPCRLVVETADGVEHVETVRHPRGSPEHPLAEDDLREKFHDLASSRLDRPSREAALDSLFAVAELDDVGDLTEVLVPRQVT